MMNGLLWAVAASVVGVDAGWQPVPEGGVEYIIQINPESLPLMKPGFYFTSEVPPEVRDIRRYRITVGSAKLPQQLPPPPKVEPAPPPTTSFPPEPTVSRPLPDLARWPAPPADTPHILPTTLEAEPIPPAAKGPAPASPSPVATQAALPAESKPWLPFILSLLFLFASLGANFYLGWMLFEQRTRYRSLLTELRPAELT